jgi:hypothetical protein
MAPRHSLKIKLARTAVKIRFPRPNGGNFVVYPLVRATAHDHPIDAGEQIGGFAIPLLVSSPIA